MVTPGMSKWCISTGSSRDAPSAGSRLKMRAPLPPAQARRMASPRITPMSWQVCIESTRLMTSASSGARSGISTISKKSQVPPADELL